MYMSMSLQTQHISMSKTMLQTDGHLVRNSSSSSAEAQARDMAPDSGDGRSMACAGAIAREQRGRTVRSGGQRAFWGRVIGAIGFN